MIPKPHGGTELSDKIRNDSKFYPFFDNREGALDETHIPAVKKWIKLRIISYFIR